MQKDNQENSLSNSDTFQQLTHEEAIKRLAAAQKTLDELQEIHNLTLNFFKMICSYDIRPPLTSIVGFSKVILKGIDGPITELMRIDLTAIEESGNRIQQIIDTAFDALHVEQVKIGSRQEPPPVKVNLGKAIEATGLAEKEKVQVNTDTERLPNVLIDPDRLQRVLLTTASALSKTSKESEIVLEVDYNEEWLTIRMNNRGLYFDKDDLEPFSKLISAPTLLALGYVDEMLIFSINRFYIERYGGTLSLNSKAGTGTTVTITLPIYPESG